MNRMMDRTIGIVEYLTGHIVQESVAHGNRHVVNLPKKLGIVDGGTPDFAELKRLAESLGYKYLHTSETDSKRLCLSNRSRVYVEFDTIWGTKVLKLVDPDRNKTFSVVVISDTRKLKKLNVVDAYNDRSYRTYDLTDDPEKFLEEIE